VPAKADVEWCVGMVMARNADAAVAQFIHGKTQVLGYLIGQVLRESGQTMSADEVRPVLLEHLELWKQWGGPNGEPYQPPFSSSPKG
jgi:Asp-tRNA(Asn)/Glu-tRNA(Gln) amidotransferase B subunit